MNKNQAGLALGSIFGLCHGLWAVTVGLGAGKGLLDWFASIHFLSSPFTVTGFSLGAAVTGIAVAFVAGFLTGWIFAWIWNWLDERL